MTLICLMWTKMGLWRGANRDFYTKGTVCTVVVRNKVQSMLSLQHCEHVGVGVWLFMWLWWGTGVYVMDGWVSKTGKED